MSIVCCPQCHMSRVYCTCPKEDTRTSEEWSKVFNGMILDADGWDRGGKRSGDVQKDWQYSWHKEKITREEFERRMVPSTVQLYDINNLWKDKCGKL